MPGQAGVHPGDSMQSCAFVLMLAAQCVVHLTGMVPSQLVSVPVLFYNAALPCREGKVIPWELIKRGIEARHPFSVFTVRSMLAVPFFEKAVYELPEEQVTSEAVTALADSVEKDVEGGLAGRYCLCPPATGPPPGTIIATASHPPCLA